MILFRERASACCVLAEEIARNIDGDLNNKFVLEANPGIERLKCTNMHLQELFVHRRIWCFNESSTQCRSNPNFCSRTSSRFFKVT